MSYLLKLGRDDLVSNGYNNALRREFPSCSENFRNMEIAVHSIAIYNSAFNIDADVYKNNTFAVEMPTGNTVSTINITLESGYYSYKNINDAIHRALVDAGAYLINKDGNQVFYIDVSENAVFYACQIDTNCVPNSLPAGYSYASGGLYAGAGGLPTTSLTPRLIINNEAFGKLLGFSLGNYPIYNFAFPASRTSNIVPQIVVIH